MKNKSTVFTCIIITIQLLSSISGQASDSTFQKYHTFSELSGILTELVKAHPDIAALESIGKSSSGMDIWLVKIGKLKGKKELETPAICIVGNLEGNHVVGSETALFSIDCLLKNYGKLDSITHLIDNQVFYIIPRVNSGAADLMFKSPVFEMQNNFTPIDDDFDGRLDEDGPEDLNGDGYITLMRVPDPLGAMIPDEKESRLHKAADAVKGETGIFRVETEGIDNDGDGKINEDPLGGVNINRNFPQQYPVYQKDAGPFMGSEPETRALLNFIAAHKNINILLVYGLHDNLLQVPKSKAKKKPVEKPADSEEQQFQPKKMITEVAAKDIPYLKKISAQYKKLTKNKANPGQKKAEGALHQWAYFQQGIWAFSTRVWYQPKPESAKSNRDSSETEKSKSAENNSLKAADKKIKKDKKVAEKEDDDKLSVDRDWLKWSDEKCQRQGFIEWQPFDHPDLGKVEIGGFKPYFRVNPPESRLPELGKSHTEFMLYLASLLPETKIEKIDIETKGKGVFLISVEVSNTGFLPIVPEIATLTDGAAPTRVSIILKKEQQLLSGRMNTFIEYLKGAGQRHKVQWLVHGKKGSKVRVELFSHRTGSAAKTIELK